MLSLPSPKNTYYVKVNVVNDEIVYEDINSAASAAYRLNCRYGIQQYKEAAKAAHPCIQYSNTKRYIDETR